MREVGKGSCLARGGFRSSLSCEQTCSGVTSFPLIPTRRHHICRPLHSAGRRSYWAPTTLFPICSGLFVCVRRGTLRLMGFPQVCLPETTPYSTPLSVEHTAGGLCWAQGCAGRRGVKHREAWGSLQSGEETAT